MTLTRVCEGPGCPVLLDATFRADARFCSPLCRSRKWHESRTEPFIEGANGKSERRPSRNGRGAKVYLTPEELRVLSEARNNVGTAPDQRAWMSAQTKLVRAMVRSSGGRTMT